MRSTARDGVAGAHQPLPHLDRIQSSFGRHDVSGTRTEVGGAAARANEHMGSLAYTAGDRIAFQRDPDVKLAAHEAAHVVQQRAGAKLPGGVGRPGDEYERQADAAAEAVHRGEFAEPILDRSIPGGPSGAEPVVQHRLEINALRQFEPPIVTAQKKAGDVGAGAIPTGGKGTSVVAAQSGKKDASKDDPAAKDGQQDGDKAVAQSGSTAKSGLPPGNDGATSSAKPACTSPGVASCYTEPIEEPPEKEQQQEQPTEPPPTQVQEQMGGDDPDLPEPDTCPAEKALARTPLANSRAASVAAGNGASPTTAPGKAPGGKAAKATHAPASAAMHSGAPNKAMHSAGSPLDAAVASALAQRDRAVTAYGKSSTELKLGAGRVGVLRAGVHFAPVPEEDSDQTAQRADAAAQANRFFSGIAAQLDRSITFASNQLPDSLGAQAETAKAELGASIERQKTAISSRIEVARALARLDAAMSRQKVLAQANAVAAAARTQTAAAIKTLHAGYAGVIGQVDILETSTLDRVTRIYASGRVDHEALGQKVGRECTERGDAFADKYEKCKINRWDSISAGALTDRRAKAQQKAAKEVAAGFSRRLIESAQKRAREATKAGRKDSRCSVIAAARSARATLDSQLANLTTALESTRDAAIQHAGDTRDGLIASIDTALAATLLQLDRQEHDQRQTADDTGYMQQVLQEQVAHAAAAAIQKNVVQAVNSALSALAAVQAGFAANTPPDASVLGQALSQTTQQIGSAIDGLQTGIKGGAAAAGLQLAGLARKGLALLDGGTTGNGKTTAAGSGGFAASMSQIAINANTTFSGMQAGFTQQVQQSATDGAAALAQAVAGMSQACTTVTNEAESTLAQSARDLEQSLGQNKQDMECEIPAKADEAASHEAPLWKKVLAGFLIVLVVLISVAAALVTFGAGGILATLIFGAIVGAVTGGMFTVASNLWNNRSWTEGLGSAILMGALTGAIGAGVGVWLEGASGLVASKLAQYGITVVLSAGMDIATQFVAGGFSFKDYDWTLTLFAVGVALLSVGVARNTTRRIRISRGKGSLKVEFTKSSKETLTTTSKDEITSTDKATSKDEITSKVETALKDEAKSKVETASKDEATSKEKPPVAKTEDAPALTPEQVKVKADLDAELSKRGLAADPTFQKMDPQTQDKVWRALNKGDTLRNAPQATREAAQKWALDGAGNDPRKFANRYEYARARFSAATKAARIKNAPNADANARAAAAVEVTPDKLTAQLEKDIATVREFGPGQKLERMPATPMEVGKAVQSLKRVSFETETAEAYHAVKHQEEVPPEFTMSGDRVKNHDAAVADIIQTGYMVKAAIEPNGKTLLVIQKNYGTGGGVKEAIIWVSPDGEVTLATYGNPKAKP